MFTVKHEHVKCSASSLHNLVLFSVLNTLGPLLMRWSFKLHFFSWFSIIWQDSAKSKVIILLEFPMLGVHVSLWWVACVSFAVNWALVPSVLNMLWSSWVWKHPQSLIGLDGIEFGQCWGLGKAPLLNKCGDKWPLQTLVSHRKDSGVPSCLDHSSALWSHSTGRHWGPLSLQNWSVGFTCERRLEV